MNPDELYCDEVVTDRHVGTIRLMTPIKSDGQRVRGRVETRLADALDLGLGIDARPEGRRDLARDSRRLCLAPAPTDDHRAGGFTCRGRCA